MTAQVHTTKRSIILSALNADVNRQSGVPHYHKAKAHAFDSDVHSVSDKRARFIDSDIIRAVAECLCAQWNDGD